MPDAAKGKEFVAPFDFSNSEPACYGIPHYGRKYGSCPPGQRRAAGHSDSDDPHGRDNRGDREETVAGMSSSGEFTDISDDETTADADDNDEEPFDIKSAISATQENREEMEKKGVHIVLYGQAMAWVPISYINLRS
ncbi:hypothetical protein CYMTET_42353 [Cymbomonas tetramitiformis]|uniref:Uncharacterized protein n=1 Tax=Cymbomonas tetramitiformis TaxID=36881 RepID=A0AAE0BWQ5_9CHLO|nr:hypothetical protein CYMTET_46856 [Cymbomonas tetramitiformis]KAK3248172.1 hypothetical protein CYMTET_42353 [Cymbomonas tetramitiformis]